MTASDDTPLSTKGATDDSIETPKEHSTELPARGFFSRTEARPDEASVEVTGTVAPDSYDPDVSVTIKAGGLFETSLSIGFAPADARALAEELVAQAEYAERYAEQKRKEAIHGDD